MSHKSNHTGLKIVLILIILILIAGSAFMVKLSLDLANQQVETMPTEGTIQLPTAPEATEPETEATTAPIYSY